VEVHDIHGVEFLQLCARSEEEPAAWAAYLATIAAPLNAVIPPPAPPARHLFARLPADARLLTRNVDALPALLSLLANEETSFTCTLHTPACTHTRELTPRRVICEDGLLTVGDSETTLQAALASAHGLAVQRHDHRLNLHLVGPGDTSLLTFHSAADPASALLWRAALRATFSLLD
jgi:hypothetical protein